MKELSLEYPSILAIIVGSKPDRSMWESGGVLTVSGTGAMDDFDFQYTFPGWYDDSFDITKIVIEDGVTHIGAGAFANCVNVTSVTIPNSVTSIGMDAFYSCASLTSITIPEGVETIDEYAFAYCSLKTVNLPSTLKLVKSYAFSGCNSLTDVYYACTQEEWNQKVKKNINSNNDPLKYAALHCVTRCGDSLIWEFKNGTLTISGTGPMWDFSETAAPGWDPVYDQIQKVVIEEGATSIGAYAFYNLTSLSEVTIPEGVETIGDFAFCQSAVTSITLPESLTDMGAATFGYCLALTSVSVPATVKDIKASVFEGCSALKTVELAEGVETIGESAFAYTALEELTLPSTVTSLGVHAFQYGSLNDLTLLGKTLIVDDSAFQGINSLNVNADCDTLVNEAYVEAYCTENGYTFQSTGHVLSHHDRVEPTVKADGNIEYWTCDICEKLFEDEEGTVETTAKKVILPRITALDTPVLISAKNANGGVLVTWKAVEGAELYSVSYKNSHGTWNRVGVTDGTSFLWTGAKSGTKYTFTVRCLNKDRSYASSYDAAGKTITYVAAPKLSKVENTKSGVKATWTKVTGAVNYRVFRRVGTNAWEKVGDTKNLTLVDTKAKSGTTYKYTVRAISADGKSYTSAYYASGMSIKVS